ncbi:hypothetical protein KUIN1_38250 [Pseudomonas sp. KUIN-1]|nr:hypothetical protein KUIN1_38250 [Pseudomonas sp. KUIN-1]
MHDNDLCLIFFNTPLAYSAYSTSTVRRRKACEDCNFVTDHDKGWAGNEGVLGAGKDIDAGLLAGGAGQRGD